MLVCVRNKRGNVLTIAKAMLCGDAPEERAVSEL
jgi:hypothetical protein